jgi:chemotaxis protein histidine kinase CheA
MPLINHARLSAVLSMSKQHQAQLLQMIKTLLADAETNIAQLQHYARQQQHREMQQALHKIRGGYATLGAEQLASVSKALELALEHQQPFSEQDLAEFISVYRQSCDALQAEITKLQSNTATEQPAQDIAQLYNLLVQQNMQACDLVQNSPEQLRKILSPAVAESFIQQVFALNFTAAAAILQPLLPPEHKSDIT